MPIDPRQIFSAGRLLAVKKKAPYLRAMIMGLAPVDAPGLGTIGVSENGILLIDWDFIAQLGNKRDNGEQATEEMAGLMVHEALHLLLKHGARGRKAGRDPQIDNDAADLAINPTVLEMGCKLPEGEVLPGMAHGVLHGLFPEELGFPRGETTDQYYERLRQQKANQPKPSKKPGQGGKGKGMKGAGGQGEPSDPNDEQGEGGEGGDDDHQKPGGGKPQHKTTDKPKTGGGWCGSCAGRPMPNEPDQKNPAARSDAEMGRMARQVAAAIREEGQRGKGTVPSMLQRWADELLAPAEVPWEQELAMVTRNACAWRENAADHRYDAPSRRQAGIGYGPGRAILPRLRMPVPDVTIIVDTSGSMGSRELGLVGREVNGILKAIGANITFCACDASVHGITKVRNIKEAMAAMKGGGGTDMRPAFDAVMKLRPRPQVIVCLTDLQIGDPGPQPPGVKVIWVGVGAYQGADPPWGRTVRIKKFNQQIEEVA